MGFFRNVSPTGAFADIRSYLGKKRPHQYGFMALSITIAGVIIWGFDHDSRAEVPYKPNIIYVEDWRLDRPDSVIIAQQKIDKAAKDKRMAIIAAKKEKRRKEYEKINEGLKSWGI